MKGIKTSRVRNDARGLIGGSYETSCEEFGFEARALEMIEVIGKWLLDWQTLVTGVLGFGAVWWTLTSEARNARRARDEEFNSLRHALGAEIRQIGYRALQAHKECEGLAAKGEFTIQQIENVVRFPDPIIYPAIAGRLGLLGDVAYQVVYFFSCIAMASQGVERMRRSSEPTFHPQNAVDVAGALLVAATASVPILPLLRVGVVDDKADAGFIKELEVVKTAWERKVGS